MAATPASARSKTTPGAADEATAYQIDPAHDVAASGSALVPPLVKKWGFTIAGAAFSYPVIVSGRVFVTYAYPGQSYGSQLLAVDAATGTKLWQRSLPGTYYWSALTYENGMVFGLSYDGLLKAFDAATGTPLWQRQLVGQYSFSSAPTAFQGIVYTGGAGSGGTVYAVDETNGNVLWTQPVENGDQSSPAVDAGGVYVSYSCPQVYRFQPITGAPIWHKSGPCEGGGGRTPVLSGGKLYVRDEVSFPSGYILNAANGGLLRRFKAGPAPALDSSVAVFLTQVNGPLMAIDLTTGIGLWSMRGDDQLTTAPVIAGGVVYEGSGTGQLAALDEFTGSLLWQTNVGSAIPAPDEHNVSQPLTGLGIGSGLLVVPAGATLVAYGN
jgi:outer membrane protein assembly factor BamB